MSNYTGEKYIGKNGNIEIEWDGVNKKTISDYPYIHQTPPYRVIFTLSESGISVTFDVPYNFYEKYGVTKIKNKYTNKDYQWVFIYTGDGFDVGFEFWTDDTKDDHEKIKLGKFKFKINNYNDLQKNPSEYKKTFPEVKWSDLHITDIKNYINSNKNIYFKPLCQGCNKTYNEVTNEWKAKWEEKDALHEYINDGGERISDCVSCDKFVYKIIKAHQHITPSITVLKTTGSTIKIEALNKKKFQALKEDIEKDFTDSINNELLFTGLLQEKEYTIKMRQQCDCGKYFYCTKKIKTWNVILDDKKSLDVLNCGGYSRIHVAAKQKEGTRGINSNSGNDGIKYDLYNSINNGANIGTFKTSIDHNSGDNYYTSRGGLYSSIAKFTELDSNTYYYCKAYSIDNITNQDNTPDTIKESIFKTAKKFTVDNVSITPKNDKVIISATISNLDDTYFKKNDKTYINGLDNIKINIYPTNDTPITKTFEKLSLSNISNGYGFNFSTTIGGLYPVTEYNIKLDFTGYSKYGTDHNDANEKCVRSIQRSFTTTSPDGEIIDLESSIKAVKFNLKIDDASLGSQNDTGTKYKAILYIITETETTDTESGDPNATEIVKTLYKDKYIETDNSNINNRPNYELLIPNNKFINFQDSNTTKIIEGLSFGVFNQRDRFTYLYGQNNYNEYMDESVGIDCNTTYRIEIIDNNNNIVAAYNFSTKQLEAKTDIIAKQDSITLITKPIITNTKILTDSDENNNITTSYIDGDTINTKSKIRTVIEYKYRQEYNRTDLIKNSYGIEAYSHKDYRSDNDLNSYVYNNDLSVNNDNAVFKDAIEYVEDMDGNKKIIYNYICHDGLDNQNKNQNHEVKIINNQNNQYDHTEIIHKFNNLIYYCYHRVCFFLTDGYNNTFIEIYCNTVFPYAFINLSPNTVYVGSQIETYVYHDGDWKIVIPHICKKYVDSNNEEHTKWLVCDGNQEEEIS